MSRKSVILLFLLILSPVLIYFLWPSDESRIKKTIRDASSAAQKEDIEAVMSKISYNYQDESGISYLLLKKILEKEFAVLSDIEIESESLVVEVKRDNARARLDMRVLASAGAQRGYIIGDLREPAHIALELEKNPAGKWLILRSAGVRAE